MKTADLSGPALDWAVAKCEGPESYASAYLVDSELVYLDEASEPTWEPSVSWAQGGPIINREHICSFFYSSDEDGNPCEPAWEAFINFDGRHYTGKTQLIVAMRCYVASKLGDEIEIPEELK